MTRKPWTVTNRQGVHAPTYDVDKPLMPLGVELRLGGRDAVGDLVWARLPLPLCLRSVGFDAAARRCKRLACSAR